MQNERLIYNKSDLEFWKELEFELLREINKQEDELASISVINIPRRYILARRIRENGKFLSAIQFQLCLYYVYRDEIEELFCDLGDTK